MSDPLFVPAPFFLFRSPFWSIEHWEEIIGAQNWKDAIFDLYESDSTFREGVAIASPIFHRQLQEKKSKKDEGTAITLLKYALRMSSRATPFGLFSFVAVGCWGKKTHLSIDLDQVAKRGRPDMSWIYSLIEKLYDENALFPSLSVYTNPLITRAKNRFTLQYIREKEKEKKAPTKIYSIDATTVTSAIFQWAKSGIQISDLCKKIKATLNSSEEEKILKVIKELLTQQFLLPSLLPSLLTSSPFEDFLKTVSPHLSLQSIVKKLETFNQTRLGTETKSLKEMEEEMKAIVSSEKHLQVDSYYKGDPVTLAKEVAKEAAQAAELLWRISSKNHNRQLLRPYHQKFLERYGTNRIVPLLELLSGEKGLGSFKDQHSSSFSSISKFQLEWERWLQAQWSNSFREQNPEILLDDKTVEELITLSEEKLPNFQEALTSTDLFCTLLADSQEEIDEGKFLILATHPSWQGGSTIGRFLYLFDENVHRDVEDFFAKEEQLDEGAIFIETSSWPLTGSQANVSNLPCMRKVRLDLGDNRRREDRLSLEEIYVGADLNGLYLTLKNGEKKIAACGGNLLRLELLPMPIEFIRMVTLASHEVIEPNLWGLFGENAEYLPRIRYKRAIISPATWKAHPSQFALKGKDKIGDEFTHWAEKWNLPKKCILVFGDQHLLIDREHPAFFKEIRKKLAKKETLKFMEFFPTSCCKSEKGHHLSEVIIPLCKHPTYTKKQASPSPSYLSTPIEERVKLPGSEWISAKLYLGEEEIDRFIADSLLPFGEKICERNGVAGWFFVRYHDPEFHLRFRVRIFSEDLFPELVNDLKQESIKWIEAGLVKDFILSSYERELERYGGVELMECAEALFCVDSFANCEQIKTLLNYGLDFPRPVYNTLSILHFLEGFHLSTQEKIALLDIGEKNQSKLKGYRKYKNQLIEKSLVPPKKMNDPILLSLSRAMEQRAPIQGLLEKKLEKEKEKLSSQIFASLLHMHCNRLGCNREEEQQGCIYAIETLKALEFIKKTPDTSSYNLSR